MTESLEDFGALLAGRDSIPMPRRGDLLQGRLLYSDESGAIVDLGLKRDGVIPRSDLDKLPPGEFEFQPGDEISVMVVDPEDLDGNLLVSISQARESGDWLEARRMMDDDTILQGNPVDHNRGGLIVPLGKIKGFVPASHLSDMPRGLDEIAREDFLAGKVGATIPLKVIEVDPKRRRLVFSERKAIRQWRQKQKALVIERLSVGEVCKGVVTSLREFGAFVDIGGADGLVHLSELSWSRVDNPGDVLSKGQEVETLVVGLDSKANRIALSLKRLQPNPWQEAKDEIVPGVVLTGEVGRISGVGPFVRLDGGLEGLLHLPDEEAIPAVGEVLTVTVRSFDADRERLDLEMAGAGQAEPLPQPDAVLNAGEPASESMEGGEVS